MFSIANGTPLEDTNFPFASGHQLQIDSWFQVEPHVHVSFSVPGTCGVLVCAAGLWASVLLDLEDSTLGLYLSRAKFIQPPLDLIQPPLDLTKGTET